MFEAFRLKGPIGGDMSVDLDDTLATKQALHSLGHFRIPSYGLTEYPDRPMIDGLKSFQRANGLKVDGVMRPDGPTMRKLSAALVARTPPSRPPEGSTSLLVPSKRTRRRPPLILKQPVKASASVDLDDALKIKTALARLGLLRPPKDGLSLYPDRAMIDGIEAFQRRAGLRVDGEMAPDGPTMRKLNAVLREQARNADGEAEAGSEARIRLAMTRRPGAPGQVLEGGGYHGPTRSWGNAATGLLGLGALIEMQRRMSGHGNDVAPAPGPSAPSPRTQIADPLPPVPPSEPPDDENELPDRTELPPDAGTLPSTEAFPIVDDELRDMIGGYPDQSDDELMRQFILESRGNDDTQMKNKNITRRFLRGIGQRANELIETVNHLGGSYTPGYPPTYQKEFWFNPLAGRRGARTDMTFEVKVRGQDPIFAEIQTVSTYADGVTPKPNEADANSRVMAWRNDRGQRMVLITIPKWPGVDLREWYKMSDEKLEEAFDFIEKMMEEGK